MIQGTQEEEEKKISQEDSELINIRIELINRQMEVCVWNLRKRDLEIDIWSQQHMT